RSYPRPPAERAAERRQALAQAVLTFAREHRVDTRRAYLCLPRADTAFNRVLLPAAARENLAQVLEYEMEHLIPLPRDQVYFDFSVRELGEDRLEVLLMCMPGEGFVAGSTVGDGVSSRGRHGCRVRSSGVATWSELQLRL